ncbi:hypothetical protein [Brumimicrobium mesophilum]|uniref:hypothetical protein n=1 Tax=Brumimicrobium mesophilum TaxID=392717 RepID=UPI000D140F4A|nr:hypothetical protein [Brumimicrobium mesophilum]
MTDFLIRIYTDIENKNPFLSKIKFYGFQRFIIRRLANFLIPLKYKLDNSCSHCLANDGNDQLIVSLTTFPARINKIWLVIECMLRQTHKPDKIILWLSKEQFGSLEILPKRLLKLRDRGLEIVLCEGDIRSHKKYYYTLKKYPISAFITVDDDFFYPSNMIEELFSEHQKHPKDICFLRGHMMTTQNGKVESYNSWTKEIKESTTSSLVFFTSGGGTLFPPNSLHPEATNEKVFMEICKLADDVWLNAMSKLNGTNLNKISSQFASQIPISIAQNISLSSQNVDEDLNDVQINAVRNYYLKTLNKDIFDNVTANHNTK